MNDPERPSRVRVDHLVGVRQPLADLVRDVERHGHGQPFALVAPPFEQRLQVDPVHVLHHDEVGVVGVPDVEHLDDVGVLQAQRQARLVEKHRHELLVLGQSREHPLDGDVLPEPLHRLGDALEDLGHAAGGHALGDAISAIRHESRRVSASERYRSCPIRAMTSAKRPTAPACRRGPCFSVLSDFSGLSVWAGVTGTAACRA